MIYIIGAGMAGLAAAVRCLELGRQVSVFEAAPQAGGRCRSYADATLDRLIDNGNHLILGGNDAIFAYLKSVDAVDGLSPADPVQFPFVDLDADISWTIRPSAGRIPWWIFFPSRRVPDSRLADYFTAFKILTAPPSARLVDYVDADGAMFNRFWQPLCQAVLNTDAEEGSAQLIGRMLSQTLMRGREASRPYFARLGLSAALVEPGVDYLRQRGAAVQCGRLVRDLELDGEKARSFSAGDEHIKLNDDDRLILALPPHETVKLLPELDLPTETRAIVNVHYRVDDPPPLPHDAPFVGVVGGTAHWVFRRGDVFSVTVSAAEDLVDQSASDIAALIWQDVARIIGRNAIPTPLNRVIKEKRATIAQTPEQNARRPDNSIRYKNLLLAGDWTDTGLPATVESAVQSGRNAAELLA